MTTDPLQLQPPCSKKMRILFEMVKTQYSAVSPDQEVRLGPPVFIEAVVRGGGQVLQELGKGYVRMGGAWG